MDSLKLFLEFWERWLGCGFTQNLFKGEEEKGEKRRERERREREEVRKGRRGRRVRKGMKKKEKRKRKKKKNLELVLVIFTKLGANKVQQIREIANREHFSVD